MLILWFSLIIWVTLANRPIESLYTGFRKIKECKAELKLRRIDWKSKYYINLFWKKDQNYIPFKAKLVSF